MRIQGNSEVGSAVNCGLGNSGIELSPVKSGLRCQSVQLLDITVLYELRQISGMNNRQIRGIAGQDRRTQPGIVIIQP
ncbi:hypothetical protein D3C75_1185290 [compost metagenome]